MPERRGGWRLDQRIPVGLIAAILIQGATIVWWASGKEQEDRFQSGRIEQGEQLFARYGAQQILIAERLARIEARLENQTELLRELKQKTERRP